MTKCLSLFLLLLILDVSASNGQSKREPARLLRHVVTVTFKPGAASKNIEEVDRSFQNLADKLTMVKDYEWGVSPIDAKNKDNKHVYVSSFASERDLAAYGASPEHQKHIKIGASAIKGVAAVDYWLTKTP